jgi:predicted nucleotidyltransferase
MRSRDYEEFVASLNQRGARYLVVGAHAVAFHARPRATKDLDILIEPTAENAQRVLDAIRDFLGSDLGLKVTDLTQAGGIVQLGVAPTRIDLLSRLASRQEFAALWEARVQAKFGDVEAHYISLDDLIREKESAGRDQDRADLRSLRRSGSRAR